MQTLRIFIIKIEGSDLHFGIPGFGVSHPKSKSLDNYEGKVHWKNKPEPNLK